MSDLTRIIAGQTEVLTRLHNVLTAGSDVEQSRKEHDRRLVAVLELILMRLDRIEGALRGDDDE
ncbi:MAG TPA: hypothetical protein VIG24_10620 [Acidimicrobiia bacterium]